MTPLEQKIYTHLLRNPQDWKEDIQKSYSEEEEYFDNTPVKILTGDVKKVLLKIDNDNNVTLSDLVKACEAKNIKVSEITGSNGDIVPVEELEKYFTLVKI